MAINYGVLKGTVTGHLRDADDDHYQILVSAGTTMFRIAVNVQSSLKPPDLLFQSITSLPASLTHDLSVLPAGFKKLASKPGGIAQDFVRGGIVKIDKFQVVPGDIPGANNDLKDTMEDAVVAAVGQSGSIVYAFGARFGPEKQKDKYFKFTPGNGVHDIHMNQGNDKGHAGDDGIFHDGCLIFQYPDGKYRAFFMAFQSQTFQTDDKTGHAIGGARPNPRQEAQESSQKASEEKGLAHGPGHSVGLFAGVEVTRHFQRFQIDDGDVVVRRAGHIRNAPSGCIWMPAAPRPTFTRFTTARVAASKIETFGPPRVETNTSLPSGVNFRRLAPVTSAARVCTTFLPARSRMEMVPS